MLLPLSCHRGILELTEKQSDLIYYLAGCCVETTQKMLQRARVTNSFILIYCHKQRAAVCHLRHATPTR